LYTVYLELPAGPQVQHIMTAPEHRPSEREGRPVRRMLRRSLANWLERHQHPFNRGIHLLGIPLALIVAPVLLFTVQWYWALLAFLAGYALQWIGHGVEGNDVGEWAGIKRLFGWPTVAIAPRFSREPPASAPRSPEAR
jgi:hypothetical protein